jgi:5-methylcytosine-specific restriction endonuclease McrA
MFHFLKIRYAKRSPKWPSVRKTHLENNNTCSACGRSKNLEVHHIKPVHLFPELELDADNLITLCADPCHIVFGHFMNFKKWNPSVVSDTSEYLDKSRRSQ